MTSSLRWQRPMTISWAGRADEIAAGLEVGDDATPGLVPVEPVVRRPGAGDRGVVGEDGDGGRPWRRPVAWSSWSWAGVIFTAPVPKAGSTASSAMIGTSRSTNGIRTWRPTRARVARSSGWTATAVSPRIVSGRVVATVIGRVRDRARRVASSMRW